VECCDFLESAKHSFFAIRDFLDEMDRTTDWACPQSPQTKPYKLQRIISMQTRNKQNR
jgi:hypothetical protein